jgi:hypothetical protein
MPDYVAYVDESGSKSKAATVPANLSDFGVAIALVLPASARDDFLGSIRERLPTSLTDACHITDCDAELQSACRAVVFEQARRSRAAILYEAITSEGFHHSQHVVPEQMKIEAKAAVSGPVRVSASHHNPHSHAELLANVMSKARAAIAHRETARGNDPGAAEIEFSVDQVDGRVLDEAKKLMGEIDSAGAPQTHQVTGYNVDQKKVVRGCIASSVSGLSDVPLPKYTVSVVPKSNYGVLSADVIANALHNHLREVVNQKGLAIRLNQPEAIQGFDLQDLVPGFSDNDPSDILYGFRDHDCNDR